jgi:hypothetical protein
LETSNHAVRRIGSEIGGATSAGRVARSKRPGCPHQARAERIRRITALHAQITAATRAFLAALAESDRCEDWREEGFGCCAEWLSWRLGISRNTANEKVRAARALEELPEISEAMSKGELSFSKVRALTRVATPENETELLEFAREGSVEKVERVVRGWKKVGRAEEQDLEQTRHAWRCLSVFPDDEGMYVVRGRLTPEVAAALMRAVEAASDALFARSNQEGDERRPEPPQLRADALGLVAERALAAGFGADSPVSGSRAERYQVVLHVEEPTLKAEGEPGRSELEDGTRVSAETARRLACDSGKIEVRHQSEAHRAGKRTIAGGRTIAIGRTGAGGRTIGTEGRILDVGRKTRTIPPAIRRALEARDHGCRFPGCGLRFTDAHHIRHWADGGETTLDNLVLLCRRHHRRMHEDGWRIRKGRAGNPVFVSPSGNRLADAPP